MASIMLPKFASISCSRPAWSSGPWGSAWIGFICFFRHRQNLSNGIWTIFCVDVWVFNIVVTACGRSWNFRYHHFYYWLLIMQELDIECLCFVVAFTNQKGVATRLLGVSHLLVLLRVLLITRPWRLLAMLSCVGPSSYTKRVLLVPLFLDNPFQT